MPQGLPFSATAPPAVKITAKARNLNYNTGESRSEHLEPLHSRVVFPGMLRLYSLLFTLAAVWKDAGVPPHSPLSSDSPLEDIELVPVLISPQKHFLCAEDLATLISAITSVYLRCHHNF